MVFRTFLAYKHSDRHNDHQRPSQPVQQRAGRVVLPLSFPRRVKVDKRGEHEVREGRGDSAGEVKNVSEDVALSQKEISPQVGTGGMKT